MQCNIYAVPISCFFPKLAAVLVATALQNLCQSGCFSSRMIKLGVRSVTCNVRLESSALRHCHVGLRRVRDSTAGAPCAPLCCYSLVTCKPHSTL